MQPWPPDLGEAGPWRYREAVRATVSGPKFAKVRGVGGVF
jgi:hypothetical protein